MPNEAAGAGWIYAADQYRVPFPPGTGQVNAVLSKPVGFRQTLMGVRIIAAAVAAGGGASRTFNVRKGSATGIVIATATVVLADLDALGEVKVIPVTGVGADIEFLDGDTLSIEWATAGAVAFTAGEFIVEIATRKRVQQRN
jgi:hypothetical protein